MPNQPTSLPPSFITSFARKCFTSDLSDVDFAQALTALDYIRDLELRRRREMQAALQRLNIDPKHTENIEHDLQIEYPGALDWYRSVEEKERNVLTFGDQAANYRGSSRRGRGRGGRGRGRGRGEKQPAWA